MSCRHTNKDICQTTACDAPSRELDSRIPRLNSPVNVRKLPEIFGDFCKNKTSFLCAFVENRFLPFPPVENRSPYPVLKYSRYIYIYIYIERERYNNIYIYIYIYIIIILIIIMVITMYNISVPSFHTAAPRSLT